jgi:voltage-gated potassium channel
MDESIRRLLGIRKKASALFDIWYMIRRNISFRMFVTINLVVFFALATIMFAKYEIIKRPDLIEGLNAEGESPYFIALYWLITTIATIGYGDITPISTEGRVITLFVMILGVLTFSFLVSLMTSRIVSINLGSMFGVARAKRKIDVILCGWNPTSQAAFQEMKLPGTEIVVIDKVNRPELSKSRDVHFIAGDPTNPDILRRANILNSKSIVLAMEDDSDVLLAIHVVRELNPWINIVAKINNHEHINIARSAGADQVVSPPSIGGRLISMVADEPSTVDWVIKATSREKGIRLVEYNVVSGSPFAEKKVGQVRKELGTKANIIGVDTAEGFEKIPGDDLIIEPGNKLIMLVDVKRFNL